MENSLKQRIIGALVLIALAVIFLPAILKEKANEGSFTSQIPEKPSKLEEYELDIRKIDDLIVESQQKRASLKQQTEDNSEQDKLNEKHLAASSDRAIQASEVSSNNSEVVDNKAPAETPISETISENFIDAAWVVQVASFSKQENAVRMVELLQKGDYKAYRRKVISKNKEVHRVFVGPYIEKEKAQLSLAPISKLSESEAIIKPFDPIKH